MVVGTGIGARFEHPGPEHGLGRLGTGDLIGSSIPSSEIVADDRPTIRASS